MNHIFSSCISLLLFLIPFTGNSQFIVSGPVTGGVTDQSARIYVRTDILRSFTLEIDQSADFSNPVLFSDSTRYSGFNSVIVDVDGLQPLTEYHYRFRFDGNLDAKEGSFKTFPQEGISGQYRLAIGSCNYFSNPILFDHLNNFDPDLVLHLGDWNWPPAAFGNDMMLDPEKRALSFASRYNDQDFSEKVLPYFPVDYIYDDDFSWNDGEGWTYPTFVITPISPAIAITNLITNPMPPGIREGAIQAYADHFPGYPLENADDGIHHKISLGNIDIFMLDCRNNRTPRHDAFVLDTETGLYSYEPPQGHTMLGENQLEWLLTELQNSNADWKIIGSSVVFNKGYQRIFDAGLNLSPLLFVFGPNQWTGAVLASQMSYNWVGYPEDQQAILDLVENGLVENVVVLSGDSHSCVMDDGTNAGLPELNSSGWSAGDEAYLNYLVDSVGQIIGFPPVIDSLWNGGGTGVENNNFLDAYSSIEVFGSDSLQMCITDRTGNTISCMTILHSSLITSTENPASTTYPWSVFPNPTDGMVEIELGFQPKSDLELFVADISGRVFLRKEAKDLSNQTVRLDLSGWPDGIYSVTLISDSIRLSEKIVKAE